MSLQQFAIHQIRNIETAQFDRLGRINLLFGENGSGKTSVLEAIHVLGVTRSFRSRRMDSVISRGAEAAVVRGELLSANGSGALRRIGVQRSRQHTPLVKLDGHPLPSLAELAGVLPLQLINSDSFRILEGPPNVRRQLLDWGVFHVEHQRFFPVWQRYRRCLQQRNALLRRGRMVQQEAAVWDRELAEAGTLLDDLRGAQHQALWPVFQGVYQQILSDQVDGEPAAALTLEYSRGWDSERPLQEVLAAGLERDLRQGHTRAGPHRADLRIQVNGEPAADCLSRGQIKTVVCALRIAQAKLLQQYGIKSVFLIDDLPAELDARRRRSICRLLLDMGVQVFVTSIGPHELDDCWDGQAVERFHVEHGRVTPVT